MGKDFFELKTKINVRDNFRVYIDFRDSHFLKSFQYCKSRADVIDVLCMWLPDSGDYHWFEYSDPEFDTVVDRVLQELHPKIQANAERQRVKEQKAKEKRRKDYEKLKKEFDEGC